MKRIAFLLAAAFLLSPGGGCDPGSSEPVPVPGRSLVCPDNLNRDLQEQARARLQNQPAPEEFVFLACQASAARARVFYRKELGGGRGLFFLVYFEDGTDGWRFAFEDVVFLPLTQQGGRPTDLTDILKTRNPLYWFDGETF